jgi:hypothetical protein
VPRPFVASEASPMRTVMLTGREGSPGGWAARTAAGSFRKKWPGVPPDVRSGGSGRQGERRALTVRIGW